MVQKLCPLYFTELGKAFVGDSLKMLDLLQNGSINLVITSPPFALLREKEYGNKPQDEYIEWLTRFATKIKKVLREDGSFVLDLGGAYERGKPIRSLYNYKILIKFCDEIGLNLAEEFFWHNPAKLPSPIEWVNKKKIRVKDSVNTVWWFSKTEYPKANVKNILIPYSERMKKLLENSEKYYSPKKRPSGHDISARFSGTNEGAIPPNLLQIPNTESNSKYLRYCKVSRVTPHPARFPTKLPEFFIKFLTDPGDIVLDIFAGSNSTGEAAEMLQRRWLAFEIHKPYLAASAFRFVESENERHITEVYHRLLHEEAANMPLFSVQKNLLFNMDAANFCQDIFTVSEECYAGQYTTGRQGKRRNKRS